MSELVFAAFEALGMAATKRDVARVAKALRATGDADVFALFGYVGGARWVKARQFLSPYPDRCLNLTNRINPGITAQNQHEAERYPERILFDLEELYLNWGPGACHSN